MITEFSNSFIIILINEYQARNQDFMWKGGGGGVLTIEAKVDQTTEMYFLLSDPFI